MVFVASESNESIVVMESVSNASELRALHPFDIFVQSCKSMDLYDNAWRKEKENDPMDDYVGALREGGPVHLFGRANIGLLVSFACQGFVGTLLPATLGIALTNSPSESKFMSLVNISWGLQFVVGFCSDGIGLFSYRRKSYVVFGWLVAGIASLILSSIHKPSTDVSLALVACAYFGCMIAKVVGNGLMVELSQREVIEERGQLAIALHGIRCLAASIATLFNCIAWHAHEIDTSYNWSLTVSIAGYVIAAVCILPIPFLIYCLEESNVVPACEFRHRFHTMWRLLRNRAIWQLCAFQFFASYFASISATLSGLTPISWQRSSRKEDHHPSLGNVVFQMLFAYSMLVVKTKGMDWNWRTAFTIASFMNIFVDTIYLCDALLSNANQSEWFWHVGSWLKSFPTAVQYILRIVPVVEIAQDGYEASTFAFISSFGEFTHPFLLKLFQFVSGEGTIVPAKDVPHARYIVFGLNTIGFISIAFLPRQRGDCLTLRHYGGYSSILAVLALVLYTSLTIGCLSFGNVGDVASRG